MVADETISEKASPIKVSLWLPRKVHKAVKQMALDGNTSIQGLLENCAAALITPSTKPAPVLEPVGKKESGKAPLSFGHSPWHSKLQHILDSGTNDAIEAVTRNIDVFYDYVVIREREQTASGKSVPAAGTQKAAESGGAETADPKHGHDLRKGTRRGA